MKKILLILSLLIFACNDSTEKVKEKVKNYNDNTNITYLSKEQIKEKFQKIINELDINSSLIISEDPRGIALEIFSDICFESSQVELKPKLKEILDRVIKDVLTEENDFRPIMIEGHTDSDKMHGKMQQIYPTNWELSTTRASEVVRYLIVNGVDFTRLSPVGYAHSWPFGTTWEERQTGKINWKLIDSMNATKDLKAKNRRIKIIIRTHD